MEIPVTLVLSIDAQAKPSWQGRRPLPRPQGRAGEAHRRRGRGQGVPAHPPRQFINIIFYINKLKFLKYD